MATTTPNFGWSVPTSTDLVKDGATAIETLGDSIDASLVDLKGGTTGQVLSKTSNTDLDFTWVAQDDSNAIQNALLTTTGDTIYASAASTPARLGLGTAGQVLTVNSGATAPEWATAASGGMTLISTTTLSGVSVTLSSIPATYNELVVLISGMTGNTANSRPSVRPNSSTTLGYYSGLYDTSNWQEAASPLYLSANENTLRTNAVNAWYLTIKNYASTSDRKPFQCYGHFVDGGGASNEASVSFQGILATTSAISSLVINYGGTNTFAAGTVLLYGVK